MSDTSFFNDPDCTYWWTKFPPKSVIIIDEVHFHLGRKMDYGSLDIEQEFVNWVSTHRHSQQEIYFLSQHTDQFANSILGIADKLLEIVNVKSLDLPWPISIPMSDLDELKRSFGITSQYYMANVGNFRGKAVKWSGASQQHLMSSEVFQVYKSASHGTATESSDRPSLEMTPYEGICWFARKHAYHLVPKLAAAIVGPFLVANLLFSIPNLLASSVMSGAQQSTAQIVKVEEDDRTELSPTRRVSSTENRTAETSGVIVPIEEASGDRSSDGVDTRSAFGRSFQIEERKREVKIVMLYQRGVMLNDGKRVSIGETFEIDGESETLVVACALCGVIGFESGKRIRF